MARTRVRTLSWGATRRPGWPSLIESMKQLSQEDFKRTVLQGRSEKGMPNFSSSEMASKNIAGLYAYLKGRSDGAIQPGRLEALK